MGCLIAYACPPVCKCACADACCACLSYCCVVQVCQLQRLLFKHWPQLHDLSLASCAAACAPDGLKRQLGQLTTAELQRLVCKQLRLVGQDDPWAQVSGSCYITYVRS
jgi:hypothetical protein